MADGCGQQRQNEEAANSGTARCAHHLHRLVFCLARNAARAFLTQATPVGISAPGEILLPTIEPSPAASSSSVAANATVVEQNGLAPFNVGATSDGLSIAASVSKSDQVPLGKTPNRAPPALSLSGESLTSPASGAPQAAPDDAVEVFPQTPER